MKFKWYLLSALALILSSCDKDLEVSDGVSDFRVSTEKTTYKVNEEITFKFEGNPGLISFYSGQIGSDYAYREGRILPPGILKLSFSNNVSSGAQANQLSVMASSDFDGVYTLEGIKAANWTDITSRFTLATSSTFVNSGSVDISDVRKVGKPLYILYRYIYDPAKTGTARTWGIRSFSLTSITDLGVSQLADQTGAAFAIYSNPAKEPGRSYVTTSGTLTLYLRGNSSNPTANYLEDYAVSQPFNVGSVDMGPDRPQPIKGNSDSKMDNYQFAFTKPGTYKVVFVATNATIEQSKSVVRELDITVVP